MKDGSYAIYKIPQEILVNIDFYELTKDNWINNYTEIDCTTLQGFSSGIKCTLTSLYCVRDFGRVLEEDEKDILLD